MDLARRVLKEPSVATPEQYRRRIQWLGLIYVGIFIFCGFGIGILFWKGKLFVTLTQRSNVETLVLAFLMIFFFYLEMISFRGVLGAVKIVYFALLRACGESFIEVEKRKMKALSRSLPQSGPTIALNYALQHVDDPWNGFQISIKDEAGEMGVIHVDGAKVEHKDIYRDGSNNFLAYFVEEVKRVLQRRGVDAGDLDVVEWKTIDDESTEKYLGLVGFARNLEKALRVEELWPRIQLNANDCKELEQNLSLLCPSLRDEAFLPDWEYAGEHKLPIIPEPLGIIHLQRTEKRVDPVVSMGAALVVVVLVFMILLLCIWVRPWVPGP